MKKLLLTLALILAFSASSVWAAGTCTQAVTDLPTMAMSPMKVLTFTCIGDVSGGAFPSTAVSAGNLESILGMYVVEARTYPGATNPTDLYDLTLKDAGAFTLISITDAAAATPAGNIPELITGVYGGRAIIDAPVLAITGNSVNSAAVTVKVILSR